MIGFRRLSRSFSKSLEKLERCDTGQYDVTYSGGLSDLSNIITCAFFHYSSMYFEREIVLYNMCAR